VGNSWAVRERHPPAPIMSDAAAEEVVEEVWTPKAAAAADQEARRQPKSAKFAALAGGISLAGAKSDDNVQP
jgi:hypothetical protein